MLSVFTQPVVGLQESVVQTSASSQLSAAPGVQAPPAQVSLTVQAFPSEQAAALGVYVHPVAGSQASSVQTLLSLQVRLLPWQVPPWQRSATVQAFPSSQGLVLSVFTQPVVGLQESVVQRSPSLQSTAPPGRQTPPAQRSPSVQALPSVQPSVLGV